MKQIGIIWSRATFVFLVLVCATLLSWTFGHGLGFGDRRLAAFVVIVVAFLKVRMVVLHFMELRHAPTPVRIGVEAWTVVVCLSLCTLYR